MRIRKRAVPLPLSLLSPVPFSDPHLRLVQLPPPRFSHHHDPNPPPSDDRHSAVASPPPLTSMELKNYEDENSEEQGEKGNDTSMQSISGEASDIGVLPPQSTPSDQNPVVAPPDDRWCDGDKAMPLKKRKASFEMNGVVVSGEPKMKSKTNKILIPSSSEEVEKDNDHDDDEEEENRASASMEVNKNSVSNTKTKKKKTSKKSGFTTGGGKSSSKSKKGRTIMEGSRCSRVNGRGWRCFQPTLVGYSLCEHHLGKGRFRSMSSVRVRASSSSEKPSTTPSSSSELPALSDQKCPNLALGGGEAFGNGIQEDTRHDHDHKSTISTLASAGNKNKMKPEIGKARSSQLPALSDQKSSNLELNGGEGFGNGIQRDSRHNHDLKSSISTLADAGNKKKMKPEIGKTRSSQLPALSDQKSLNLGLDAGEGSCNGIEHDSLHDQDRKNSISTLAGAGKRRKMKSEVVKARSLSSLLCQPDTSVKKHEV